MASVQADNEVFVMLQRLGLRTLDPDICGRLHLFRMQIHLKEKAENVPEFQSFLKASFLFVWLVGRLVIYLF